MIFFTDRNLGKQFPAILKEAGLSVELHDDHFAPNTSDVDWLRKVGTRGWIVLTHDRRIGYKPNEREAVMACGVALLVIVGKAPFPELAAGFVATAPRIGRFVQKHSPPYIAKVYRASPTKLRRNPRAPGRIELWHPHP